MSVAANSSTGGGPSVSREIARRAVVHRGAAREYDKGLWRAIVGGDQQQHGGGPSVSKQQGVRGGPWCVR